MQVTGTIAALLEDLLPRALGADDDAEMVELTRVPMQAVASNSGTTSTGGPTPCSVSSARSPDGAPAVALPAVSAAVAAEEEKGGPWPSLREAGAPGWDFCSEGSEADGWTDAQELLQEEPLLAVGQPAAGGSSAWGRPASRPAAPLSFAEKLRAAADGQGVAPPSAGFRAPPPLARKVVRPKTVDEDGGPGAPEGGPVHGWKREHKASWNAKNQRKVAIQVAHRSAQSRRDRGICDDDD